MSMVAVDEMLAVCWRSANFAQCDGEHDANVAAPEPRLNDPTRFSPPPTRCSPSATDGDAAAVGVEAARILAAWTEMFTEHPATGLLDRAGALAEAAGEMAFGDDEDTDDEP